MEHRQIDYYCSLIMYFYFKMLFTVCAVMLFVIGTVYYFTENVLDVIYNNIEEKTEDAPTIMSIQPLIKIPTLNITRVYEEKTDDAPCKKCISH